MKALGWVIVGLGIGLVLCVGGIGLMAMIGRSGVRQQQAETEARVQQERAAETARVQENAPQLFDEAMRKFGEAVGPEDDEEITEQELQSMEAAVAELERLATLPTPHAPAVDALERIRPGVQDLRAARNIEALMTRAQDISNAEYPSPSDAETAYRQVLAELSQVSFGGEAARSEMARRHARLVRELERKHRGVEQRAFAQRERERITSRGLTEVTARELFREYQSNEVQADARYLRRALAVDGVVHSVSRGLFGAPIVHLRTSNQFMPVDADFESLDQAGRLEPGTRVLLECQGGGVTIGRPQLDDCSIITTWL